MKLRVLYEAVPILNDGIMEENFDKAPLPFHARLDERMVELGLSNAELATLLGYEKPNVIALIRSGKMRMPIQKVLPLANALDLPAREVFEALMSDSMPEVLQSIWAIYNPVHAAQN